jgi:PAS domain S-box-containing protein
VGSVPTHILLVEDNPGDARFLRELLVETESDRFRVTHVDRLSKGVARVNEGGIDLILLDLSLPDSQGFDTLSQMHGTAAGIPIVVMTGTDNETLGVQLIQQGAQDYLVKGQVTGSLLQRSLRYAVERARMGRELETKTNLLQSVLDNMAEGVVMADEQGRFQLWNQAADKIVGSGPADVRIDGWSEHYAVYSPDKATPYPSNDLPLAKAIRGESISNEVLYLRRADDPDGTWISVNARPLHDKSGRLKGGVVVFRDISLGKRMEEALLESQARYRLLVTRANDIIYRTDEAGQFTFVNPVATRIMKYSEKELLGRTFIDLIHPDYRQAAERFYGRQFVRRTPSTYFEFIALSKTGAPVWIGQNVQVLLEQGKVIGFQAVARDITDRKRAEEALLESEERLRSIVQSTGDAIILMDALGKVAFWNFGAEKIFGYTAEDMIGESVTRIIPERFREAHQRGVRRAAADGRLTRTSSMMELVGLRKDGAEIPLEFSMAAWTTKANFFITGIMRDISERKRAEAALRESEERFKAIMDHSPSMIFLKDPAGRYLQVSRKFADTFHLKPEEVIGKTDADIFPPEQATAFRAHDREVFEAGRGIEFEETAQHDDGLHTSIVMKFPLFTPQGQRYALCGMTTDITDRKRAEEERAKLARERLLLLESTGDGIYGLDLQGRCTFINTAGAHMLGYDPEELMGRNMHQLVHHSFSDGSPYPVERCHINQVMRSEQGCHVDTEVLWRKDGTAFSAEYSSFPVFEQDRIMGAVVIFLDITARKRLEHERTQRALRLLTQQSALTSLAQSKFFQTSDLMAALRHITEMTARTLSVARVGIWRYSDDRCAVHCVDSFELLQNRHTDGMTISIDTCRAYFKTLATSQMIAVDEVQQDPRIAHLYASHSETDRVTSVLDIPLYLFGKLEGVIRHEHIGPGRNWMEDEWMFAIAISNLVALAYEDDLRRRTEAQLQQSQERLRSLTGRLESIQEEERTRIAREVHDELGQSLTAVKLELSLLRDQFFDQQPALLARADSIGKLVDMTMQSVRKIATELRPAALDQLGLVPAIEWQARDFLSRTGIQCRLNIYLRSVALSADRSTGVFRIFQEILTNVARHAQASSVDISMQEHAGHLLLEVTDNGRGITEEQVTGSKSLGLLGMRERALLLGGETMIQRHAEQGTTVRVRIPLDQPSPG